MHRFLARLFGKHQRRAARSDYRKPFQARLTVERLEERALMTLTAFTPLTIPPALHSLVGAPATLYLDFDGNFETSFRRLPAERTSVFTFDHMKDKRSGIITPAFDADGDGNPGGFSQEDVTAMRKIWQRVAEDYAPFNIDVTTVDPRTTDPGAFYNPRGLHVVIGGSAFDWLEDRTSSEAREASTGISTPGSFSDGEDNVVYVFSGTIREEANTPWMEGTTNVFRTDRDGRRVQLIPAVATTASHEAGHAFGLLHQTSLNTDGSTEPYSTGGADWTPIMGANINSDRTKWWNGVGGNGALQDDMAVIADLTTNGFGYRPQEALRTLAVQSPYTSVRGTSGVISKTSEQDWFTFTTPGGPTQISVIVAAEGPNLDATLQVFRAPSYTAPYLTWVGYADATPTATDQGLNASVYTSLIPGTYYVLVGSHGTYGDVGQYTVAVTSGLYPMSSILPAASGMSYYGGGSVGSGASYYGGGGVGSGGTTGGASAQSATMIQDQATAAPRSTARAAAVPAGLGGNSPDDHTRALLAWTAQRRQLPLDAVFARLSARASHRLGKE